VSSEAQPGASLAAALVAFQAELPEVVKGDSAEVQTKTGGTYRYRYANLADVTRVVMPVLARHGLAFMSRPHFGSDGFMLAYTLVHESGECREGCYPLPATGSPQAIGSAITYARRYCLLAVTGVAPDDDDDGQAAETAHAERQRTRARIPGPEHERLRQGTAEGRVEGAQRTRGPVPDDQNAWQDQPADGPPAEDRPGSILPAQRMGMFGLLGRLGVSQPEKQLDILAGIVGHPVISRTDLSYNEAVLVIRELARRANVAEEVKRAGGGGDDGTA